MNRYLISHKIKTLSKFTEPFEYKGFKFEYWDFNNADGWIGDAWVAIKEIEANKVEDAINMFRAELQPIVERMTFIGQCYFDLLSQSFLIKKINNNAENVLFLRYTSERSGVSLHFNNDEQGSLEKLESLEKQAVFSYVHESTKANTLYTRLAMLIITLESIAGQTKNERRDGSIFYKTDKDKLKEVLCDDELYDNIFAPGVGIRNKIFHGEEVELDKDYIENIYDKIVHYFNETYDTQINVEIINPQRNFDGVYMSGNSWLKLKNRDDIKLQEAHNLFCTTIESGGDVSKFRETFDTVIQPPAY